ncbi:MAG: class I SAM-dependent methyltransferase [Proteobacteria bacterium]|nr:class I SAM-dependent methyltransferase [Pseudomonadota bacterium]
MNSSACPLCLNIDLIIYHEDSFRHYLQCTQCELVFVPEKFWLSKEEEKKRYDLHINDPEDQGYQKFLSRLSMPLLKRLESEQQGLDFGCGPGPTLSKMLERAGHSVNLYDLHYHNDPVMLQKKYDFITATEVVEHLHHPAESFALLFDMLVQKGWLGIMTKQVIDKPSFSTWHYIRDLTHICFYNNRTFEYIARRYRSELLVIGNDVVLFKKMETQE